MLVMVMANKNNERIGRVRKRMFKKQKGLCHLCGETMAISQERCEDDAFATFDHIVPRSHGGTASQENLRLAHKRCNVKRGNTPLQKMSECTWTRLHDSTQFGELRPFRYNIGCLNKMATGAILVYPDACPHCHLAVSVASPSTSGTVTK